MRRSTWNLALASVFFVACASGGEPDAGESESAVEIEKTDVENLVRLTDQLHDQSVSLEEKSARLAGIRDQDQYEALRTEIGELAAAVEPVLRQLRARLDSPTLPLALKRAGYLDVPSADVRAQIARLDDLSEKLGALEPAAMALLVADDAHLRGSIDELVTRTFAVAPMLQIVTSELRRWLQDYAKAPVPQWEESLLTTMSARDANELAERIQLYRARLQEVFPHTFKSDTLEAGDGNVGLGSVSFAGPTGGEDLRSESTPLRAGGAQKPLAASEDAWFEACLQQLSDVARLAPPGRTVVAASCGTALPGFDGVSSDFTFVTIAATH